jgi:restriction system protein
MARKGDGTFENLTRAPWPVGLVFGVIFFAVIRYGIPAYFEHSASPILAKVGASLGPAIAPLAWVVLIGSWLASLLSLIGARRRRRLLDVQRNLDSIAALGWKHFELLVAEAYRRQGYRVEETGQGGADCGIDLILRRSGEVVLVQCKQWRTRKVPVNVVREMHGLMHHHGAHAVKLICVGVYTPDAVAFAEGKPIELVTGEALLGLVRSGQGVVTSVGGRRGSRPEHSRPVQDQDACAHLQFEAALVAATADALQPTSVECPRCASPMVKRKNRRSGEEFWGCSKFPGCRGVRVV